MHDEPAVHRDTTVIEDGHDAGTGFGAGMMVAALAILAAVIIGLALLFTQPWDDDSAGTNPNVPDTSDNAPSVPDAPDAPDVPAPDAPSAPDSDSGDPPAQ
jgi:hypothetical protein